MYYTEFPDSEAVVRSAQMATEVLEGKLPSKRDAGLAAFNLLGYFDGLALADSPLAMSISTAAVKPPIAGEPIDRLRACVAELKQSSVTKLGDGELLKKLIPLIPFIWRVIAYHPYLLVGQQLTK